MKVKLQNIINELDWDVDSAVVNDFYKIANKMTDSKGFINTNKAEFQLFLRDFLESHENDYQYDLIKDVLEPYYDKSFDKIEEADDMSDKWNNLNGTEQSAAELAVSMYRRNPSDIEEIVSDAIAEYDEGNAEEEYEDEDFYNEEANYSKVLSYVKQKLGLDESFNKIEEDDDEEEYEDYEDYDDEEEEITPHVDIEQDDDYECPYLSGYCDEDIDIYDRGDLSETELWATGWVGIVRNVEDGPFKSFDDMNIDCIDNEKGEDYSLPTIPEEVQKEFVKEVNNFIKNNNAENESNITEGVTTLKGEYEIEELAAIENELKDAFKDYWKGTISLLDLEATKQKLRQHLTDAQIQNCRADASAEYDKQNTQKVTEAEETPSIKENEDENKMHNDRIDSITNSRKDEVEDEPFEQTSILEDLENRIGQKITVGELNTILQSLLGQYNTVFLLVNDLYNQDPDELQNLVVWDDEDMYTITYEITDIMKDEISITDVTVE